MIDDGLYARRNWLSILLLFLVMMLSGGNHLFIRNPICVFIIITYGCRIYRIMGGISLQYIPLRIRYFFIAFISVITLQVLIMKTLDSAALATLSNLTTGLFVFTYYKLKGFDNLLKDITFLLKILIVWGLLSAVLYTFLPNIFQEYTFIDSYGDRRKISHFAFLFFRGTLSSDISRLSGFFWEPGIYQIYLNFFLIIQFSFYKQKWWIVAALLSVLLTQSTTGYISLSITLIYIAFRTFYRSKDRYVAIAILFASILCLGYGYRIVKNNVTDKVSGKKSGSFFARQADVIAGITLTYKNPLIGIGANTDRYKQMRSKISRQGELSGAKTKNSGTTNGLISLMYIWGLPIAIWYLWGMCRQTIVGGSRWLITILLLLSLNSEPLAMTPFFLLFVYSGLDRLKINNLL